MKKLRGQLSLLVQYIQFWIKFLNDDRFFKNIKLSVIINKLLLNKNSIRILYLTKSLIAIKITPFLKVA